MESDSPPPIEYEVPSWACPPQSSFQLEIIKSGLVVDEMLFEPGKSKDHYVLGRLPVCDVRMEHGSISRYHAVLQFGPEGAFIFDLGSAHGTFVNKGRVESRRYILLPPDTVLRFGESTRLYALSTLSTAEKDTGPEAWDSAPLEYLRQWLKSRDEQIEYETEPVEDSTEFHCTVYVPRSLVPGLDSSLDAPTAEANGPSKKAALEAAARSMCELLSSAGAFIVEPFKMRPSLVDRRNEEREADADSFYDRTQSKRPHTPIERIETAASLYKQEFGLLQAITTIQCQIADAESILTGATGEEDDIDVVLMAATRSQATKDLSRYRSKLSESEAQLHRVQRLLAVADPKEEQRPSESNTGSNKVMHTPRSAAAKEGPQLDLPAKKTRVETRPPSPAPNLRAAVVEETEEWLPPDSTESLEAQRLKAKYGY